MMHPTPKNPANNTTPAWTPSWFIVTAFGCVCCVIAGIAAAFGWACFWLGV